MAYSSKTYFFLLFIFLPFVLFSQIKNEILQANSYYENGEYAKAQILYEKLLRESPRNIQIYKNLLDTYNKTANREKKENLVQLYIDKNPKSPLFLIDAAYLKKNEANSQKYIDSSFEILKQNPSYAYSMAIRFGNYNDPKNALKSFQVAEKVNSKYNFSTQKARLYGELGMVDSMLYNYFAMIDQNPARKSNIRRYIESYLRQNRSDELTDEVRKVLLIKIQETNNPIYNELLMWFFMVNNDYRSASTQAKSLYLRSYYDLQRLLLFANEAEEKKDFETAINMYSYIREKSQKDEYYFESTRKFLELQSQINESNLSNEEILVQYEEALKIEGFSQQHFLLIESYIKFLSKSDAELALNKLNFLTEKYQNYDEIMARKYLIEGDIQLILVDFNKSFLAYQKAEAFTSDQYLEDEAKFKSLKIAFYKEDFKWALQQSKVLKKSISKYYANDSAELMILLHNSYKSDSNEVALKLYSKAELFKEQNKLDSSYTYFSKIYSELPYHYLKANALYSMAEIYLDKKEYEKGTSLLIALYEEFPSNNITPLALYKLCEVYLQNIKNKEEAKYWFEELAIKFPNNNYTLLARELYFENI